jgi:DNA-binding SARP family transcriptional activator
MSSADIKAILESLTALKLSGADMIALLKQLMVIISEMNANQAMAPVRETILARLTGAITDVAARTAAQATLMALSNTVSNLPTLMPGGSTRKRNKKHKKTTRKNKKVTKKQKKRRKQNKKTKRK